MNFPCFISHIPLSLHFLLIDSRLIFFLPHLHKTFIGSGGVSVSHTMSHNSGYFVILSPVSAQHLDPQGQWAAFLLHVLPGTHL